MCKNKLQLNNRIKSYEYHSFSFLKLTKFIVDFVVTDCDYLWEGIKTNLILLIITTCLSICIKKSANYDQTSESIKTTKWL